MKWTEDNIPPQTSRTVVVTGANSGLGYETARALAGKGARVILACRSPQKGQAAVARILAEQPASRAEFERLDLADLKTVTACAERLTSKLDRVDILINNAGVGMLPLGRTAEGFELQFGVNFLGHFALTGQLLPLLEASKGARVVTLSSLAYRGGQIDFVNLRAEKGYKAIREYQQSKLACLLFALELQRRFAAVGARTISLAAHPGWCQTGLARHVRVEPWLAALFAMSADQGALSPLFAATAPTASGGSYVGPDGLFELRGYPAPAKITKPAHDQGVAVRLWQVAEQATGVQYLG